VCLVVCACLRARECMYVEHGSCVCTTRVRARVCHRQAVSRRHLAMRPLKMSASTACWECMVCPGTQHVWAIAKIRHPPTHHAFLQSHQPALLGGLSVEQKR
jgi:hypothetical protein